jgi:two-component system chemotaxis sensor kinase CheA
MSGVTPEIAADFIVEAQEILDRLGEQLVTLEHATDDRDQLNAVFRGFHTLKGGAGFLGIHAMVELCHAAEETLGSVRAGQAVLEAQHFDAAQRSLDWLQSMLDAVAGGTEPAHAPPELIAQFSLDPVAAPAPVAAAKPVSAAPSSDLIDDVDLEALLFQLHGGAAPGTAPAAPPAPAVPAARAAATPTRGRRAPTRRRRSTRRRLPAA